MRALRAMYESDFAGGVECMRAMFKNCRSLTEVDISTFQPNIHGGPSNTAANFVGCVTAEMFYGCSSLSTIWVSDKWTRDRIGQYPHAGKNYNDVTDMFAGCTKLVGSSGFGYTNNPNANKAAGNYAYVGENGYLCAKYTEGGIVWKLDGAGNLTVEPRDGTYGELPSFGETSDNAPWRSSENSGMAMNLQNNVRTFSVAQGRVGVEPGGTLNGMFNGCTNLTGMNFSGFDTGNATSMNDFMAGCANLGSVDVSSLVTGNVTSMKNFFSGCQILGGLNLGGFDTSNVTDFSGMFMGCRRLQKLDLNSFNTLSATNMANMFNGCESVTELGVGTFQMEGVTDMQGMFMNDVSLATLNLTSWVLNPTGGINASQMFSGDTQLTTVYAGAGWQKTRIATATDMWLNCQQDSSAA